MNTKNYYLDNAATSHPKPRSVYEQHQYFLKDIGASAGRSGYALALEADREIYRVRELAARLIGVNDSSRIVFTYNTTHALNMALKGVLKSGDEVVVTSMEHNSVMRPLHNLEKHGIHVKVVRGSEDGFIHAADLRKTVCRGTRLLVMNHVSNVVGTIQPVEEGCEIAHAAGALFLVDAAQSLGHLPVNLRECPADFLAAAGHKGLLGPPGTGILYVSPHVSIDSIIEGGTGSRSESSRQPDFFPDFLESGTMNMPGIAGLGAGIEFILEQGFAAIREKQMDQASRLLDGLLKTGELKLYGSSQIDRILPVISFNIKGMDPADVTTILNDRFGIMARAGLHCAPLAHQTIGSFPAGTIRISPGHFNAVEDLDFFLCAIREVAKERSR